MTSMPVGEIRRSHLANTLVDPKVVARATRIGNERWGAAVEAANPGIKLFPHPTGGSEVMASTRAFDIAADTMKSGQEGASKVFTRLVDGGSILNRDGSPFMRPGTGALPGAVDDAARAVTDVKLPPQELATTGTYRTASATVGRHDATLGGMRHSSGVRDVSTQLTDRLAVVRTRGADALTSMNKHSAEALKVVKASSADARVAMSKGLGAAVETGSVATKAVHGALKVPTGRIGLGVGVGVGLAAAGVVALAVGGKD